MIRKNRIPSAPLRLAVVVHGRFYAFDLSRELIRQGIDLILLTNYPKYVAQRFGIPCEKVINCVTHGVLSRLSHLGGRRCRAFFEPVLHRWFSRWAAGKLGSMEIDAIHTFSGVSEELMLALLDRPVVKAVVRGSAHVRTQDRLLEQEEARSGQSMDRPSPWMIAREEREYELADLLFVLSSFAYKSFEREGVPAEKLRLLPLGSEVARFGATLQDIEGRCSRILAGEPLRILTVGSFSLQKGALDLIEIATRLKGRAKFLMVGDIESKTLQLLAGDKIEFLARQPQFSLPEIYRNGDVFLFPTIQDGYAVVLAQAQAAGLPILATPNCGAPDIVEENRNGWILPIRNPGAFIERLEWCDANREALARMVRFTHETFRPRDWSDVATDLIDVYTKALETSQLQDAIRLAHI